MKYEIERQKGTVNFKFTVSQDSWEDAKEQAYQQNKKKYAVNGFRKGKVPKKIIEKYYGEGVFFDDAFNIVASKGYSNALQENLDVYPVDEPQVGEDLDITEDNGIKFSLSVTTKPEVKLGDYKGIKIDKVEYNVTSEDIDKELESVRERNSRLVKVEDREVKDGDTVNLDYSGSVDGVKFDGGTAEKQTLIIGSNSFIPGFEEQMIGIKIGEEKDLKVKFPEDYHAEELKGKEAIFHVKVNEISFKELPELNDEFAKDVSKFDTLDEYKKDIEAKKKEQNEKNADNENKNNLVDAIVEKAEVEIPKCMIDSEVDYMLQDFEYRLMYMYQGMKIDDYFKYTGSSKEKFKEERQDDAKKAVKTRLVLESIIKAEDVTATDAEVDEKIKKIAESGGKDFDEYRKGFEQRRIDQLKNEIVFEKLMDFLVANNTLATKK